MKSVSKYDRKIGSHPILQNCNNPDLFPTEVISLQVHTKDMFPQLPFSERFSRLNSHFSALWVEGTKVNQRIWASGFFLMDLNSLSYFPFIETGLTYCLQLLLTFIAKTLSPQISSVSPTTTQQIPQKQVHLV